MYLSEIPTKPLGMLTHLQTLANPASESIGSSSRLSRPSAFLDFCRLPCSLDWSVLSTSLDCPSSVDSQTFLLSFSSGLVGNLACKPFVWASQQKQTKESSDWHLHPHPQKRMPPTVSHVNSSWIILGLEVKKLYLHFCVDFCT